MSPYSDIGHDDLQGGSMTTTDNLHVVFGTGAIGMALIEELHAGGKPVRAVNRSGTADAPDGVEVVGGDASSEEFATGASADADVVYFTLNPPYTDWPDIFPPLQAAVLEGAASAGAKLSLWTTSTCMAPRTANRSPKTFLTPQRRGRDL
jgi:hypothetical protein